MGVGGSETDQSWEEYANKLGEEVKENIVEAEATQFAETITEKEAVEAVVIGNLKVEEI